LEPKLYEASSVSLKFRKGTGSFRKHPEKSMRNEWI
jgi:hypothetical protein